jgi:hypothetical protein
MSKPIRKHIIYVVLHDGMVRHLDSRWLLLELHGRTFAIRNGEKKTREVLAAKEEMLLSLLRDAWWAHNRLGSSWELELCSIESGHLVLSKRSF